MSFKSLFLSTLVLLSISANAQTDADKQTTRSNTQTYEDVPNVDIDSVSAVLEIPDNVSAGSNGTGLAYDPVKKLYYSAFAGNSTFPFIVFKSNGKVLDDKNTTMIDVRGLWYNPKTAAIEANGYAEFGIVQYQLDKNGVPTSHKTLFEGQNQPDANSVGVLDPVHNEILFLEMSDYDGVVHRYSRTTGKELGVIELKNLDDLALYNTTTMVYTGIKGAELGIVDYELAIIYLFDVSTGENTKQVTLPLDAVVEDRFNFAFANGMFWFFDTVYRKWYGYRMPKN